MYFLFRAELPFIYLAPKQAADPLYSKRLNLLLLESGDNKGFPHVAHEKKQTQSRTRLTYGSADSLCR